MLARVIAFVFFLLGGLTFLGLIDVKGGGLGFAELGVAALVLSPVVDHYLHRPAGHTHN